MIQHDCIHRSFFPSRKLCDIVGSLLSPLAMTPYQATRLSHNLHHSHVGDIERRDTFEIYVMTLAEWREAGFWQRIRYRIYRSPLTLVFLGPFVLYLILRRFPLNAFQTGIWDAIFHNVLIATFLFLIWSFAGIPGLLVWLSIVYLTSSLGALIPYIVHNFENVQWGKRDELDFTTAALEGSSVLDWGNFFHLVSMNIGFHDLHHLNAKIPGYNLKEAHESLVEQGLVRPEKIGFIQGLGCLRWKLYDEENGGMVSFPARNMRETTITA
jgi:omega-6 fatty acid desaturase (delta-12 desaturase)